MGLLSNGKCTSTARLEGKTVVITGCNTGIGKHTALDMYSRGARVIMACRSLGKAEESLNSIKDQLKDAEGTGELVLKQLDLSSLSSVRTCANELLQEEERIDILINNAGIMMCPKSLTEDGYELQFATNHLGHFLLTLLLLPKIIQSAPSRIVNVSSIGHMMGDMHLDDINLDESYTPMKAYARSKLANILFTKELAKRLEGTGVTVYALHPGAVNTELARHLDCSVMNFVAGMFFKTPEDGAQTSLYCALDEKAGQETGLYYSDCKVTKPSAKARDPELAKQLWDVSIKMVHLEDYDAFKKD